MRALIVSAALVLIASAASAQPAMTRARPTTPLAAAQQPVPPETPPPPEVSTVATDLSGLNTRIEQDEVRMTQLRDAELARENAAIRAIKPALKFHDRDWFPAKY
jgi:hypothetical protein